MQETLVDCVNLRNIVKSVKDKFFFKIAIA
jgi:hypothetical protein